MRAGDSKIRNPHGAVFRQRRLLNGMPARGQACSSSTYAIFIASLVNRTRKRFQHIQRIGGGFRKNGILSVQLCMAIRWKLPRRPDP